MFPRKMIFEKKKHFQNNTFPVTKYFLYKIISCYKKLLRKTFTPQKKKQFIP